jgi:hypothetical protein
LADAYERFKVTTPGHGQLAVLTRLREIHAAMPPKTPGHQSVQMTKIPLLNTIQLQIGGQTVEVTHLYTQVGNAHELRCYLGNTIPSPGHNPPDADGIYQRVHTSIRDDDGTAHTMVQTSKAVAIPGVTAGSQHKSDAPATRIGFDSREDKGKGGEPPPVPFSARELWERPKDQGDVREKSRRWVIRGQSWHELKDDELAGARLLADRFNAALDLALADLMKGLPIEPKTITRLRPGFTGLDPM